VLVSGDCDFAEPTRESVDCLLAASGRFAAAVVDSYDVPVDAVGELARRLPTLAFADFAPFPPADLVVVAVPCVGSSAGTLGGGEYLTVADELMRWRGAGGRPADGARLRLLVAFGGVDSANATSLALDAVTVSGLGSRLDVVCVLPDDAPHAREVDRRLGQLPHARRFGTVADLGPIYADSTVAIGAPGVSQAERAFCGVPTLLVPQNGVQSRLATAWAQAGAASAVPAEVGAVAAGLDGIVSGYQLREGIRSAGLALVDGNGAMRISRAIARISRRAAD
jgi:spore coat polysaccharide biosynthesis predicted glycosyltransferase SpsG